MRIQPLIALLAFTALSAVAGCGRSLPLADPPRACVFDRDCEEGLRCVNGQCLAVDDGDGGRRGSKLFGEPCEDGGECLSGHCLGGPRGAFCSNECGGNEEADAGTAEACPSGFVCKLIRADLALCALPQPLVCQPCTEDLECGASGADLCIPDGLHGFCGQDCTFTACPDGYTCADTERGRQCQPLGQSCDCGPDSIGRLRGCANENAIGACYGNQVCTPTGWSVCTALEAAAETCNGFDDDCNGLVDDGPSAPTCVRQNGFGTCTGPQTCLGAGGFRCDAPTPAAETCNYVDDDCNGTVDDAFRDAQGRYLGAQHCGGCGNRCETLILNSATTQCGLDTAGNPECRALTCQPGFYPSADGKLCLRLDDSLCDACATDADCKGPGSRCITVDGQKVCGRACGPGTATPACPPGYACAAAPGGGSQCQPTNGTCQCNASQLGTTRSCSISTCEGFQTCASAAGGPRWSACDVDSFNPEICDGADNNCNGLVDEGFRNPSTNRYDANAHCGFCNNDCSKYWSPTLQHTTGVCDASSPTAMPTCRMGPCTTEVVGGITHEWVDVNGETGDGCECRRVQGNLTTDEPQEVAPFIDENCDGVDGVAQDAIFVWAGAAPGGNGSITQPFQTITQGRTALLAQPAKRYVLVAEGVYNENVSVTSRVRLYGGYSRDFKRREPALYVTLVQAQPSLVNAPTAAILAINVTNGAQPAAVSGFTLRGWDVTSTAGAGQPGVTSHAVYVRDSSSALRIVGNDIIAGRGGRGGAGQTGTQGFGRQQSVALDGQGGGDQTRHVGLCSGINRPGGAPGQNAQCGAAGANGAAGGGVGCPQFDWSAMPVQGSQAPFPPGSGRNGEGGFDWSFDTQSGGTCSHVTESGFPSNIQTHDGRNGLGGLDGSSGSGGTGAPARARFGSFQNGQWRASPFTATDGSVGGTAEGGGGGGAGGGTFRLPGGACGQYEIGATGGGGGAGGCGGQGGRSGGAGGASIAVFIAFDTLAPSPSTNLPVVTSNRIERNHGGDGGNGGFGGAGGIGGAGGFGGVRTTWSGSTGGKGGDGGNGGAGGGGGGGAGGPSFGILATRVSNGPWSSANTFLTPASSNTGGKGGAGGSSSGAGATGTPGTDGASANVHALLLCGAGCPGGGVCDAVGVCAVP